MPKDRVILVTGGAGFLGSHLCREFLREGCRVVAVDNFLTGDRGHLRELAGDSRFQLIERDVTKGIEVSGPVDGVLHFASPASPLDYHHFPIQTLKVGALGTHNSLGLAKAKKAVFLLASTSEVYGDPLVHPQREDYWGNVNPVGPRGVYDEAKRYAEALAMAYHRVHKMDIKIVRIFNTFGPRMRLKDGRAIPEFIRHALGNRPIPVFGDGKQTRSFCYIDDMVAGIRKLFASDLIGPVNLGNPFEMSLLDLAKQIVRLTGSKSTIEFKPLPVDDPKVRQPEISLAKSRLGWSPQVSVEEGLKKTIAYFRERLEESSDESISQ